MASRSNMKTEACKMTLHCFPHTAVSAVLTHTPSPFVSLTVPLKHHHKSVRFPPKRRSNFLSSQLYIHWTYSCSGAAQSEKAGSRQASTATPCWCSVLLEDKRETSQSLGSLQGPAVSACGQSFLWLLASIYSTSQQLMYLTMRISLQIASGHTHLMAHLTTHTCDREIMMPLSPMRKLDFRSA